MNNHLFLIMILWSSLAFCQGVDDAVSSSHSKFMHLRFTDNSVDHADYEQLIFPFDGTYQFIFLNGKKSIFTDEVFNTIEQHRKKSERTILQLSPHCKVIILSEEEIQSPDFVPLQRQYVFE